MHTFLAFRLANRAMLMQQYHYGYLKSRPLDSEPTSFIS